MKKFFTYFSIVVLFSAWGIVLTNKEETQQVVQEARVVIQRGLKIDQPCSKPLEFSVGTIDPNFGVSPAQLEQLAEEAALIWNKASGRTMLQYNPTADFKINLVYDTRQIKSDAAEELDADLQSLEMTRNQLSDEYASLNTDYQKKIASYEKALKKYKENLEEYNDKVEYWNEKGGAPKDIYEELNDEKKDLKDDYDELKKQQKEINALAGESNKIIGQENQIVSQYNSTVSTYKEKYGGAQEFEKGIFDGKEINIYQFQKEADLRLTLVHEFGHYLGLGHVENSKSIMHYIMRDQNMEDITLTAEDLAELEKICKI